MNDYYSILQIDVAASADDIKKAYHQLAKKYHPDRNGGNTSKFQQLQIAYETLSDPQRRNNYNMTQFLYSDIDDPLRAVFDDIFLHSNPFMKTDNINITISVTLEELYRKQNKRIKFYHTREDNGRYIKRQASVKIPVEETVVILRGEANDEPGFTVRGDVIIEIKVKPHKIYERIGDYDLVYKQLIPVAAIYSDYYFTLHHLDDQPLYLKCKGRSLLENKNVIQKVEGYGLPISENERGDLYIDYKVQYPESLEELKKSDYICDIADNLKQVSITTQASSGNI